MSSGRKTNNSQKSATHKMMQQDSNTHPPKQGGPGEPSQSPVLNQALLGNTSNSFTMASMEDIAKGKHVDEAFENLSTDEKLSLILKELRKMKTSISTLQNTSSSLKQQVDTHETELRSADDATSKKIEDIEQKSSTNAEDIINIHDTNADLAERLATAEGKINQNALDINGLKGTAERQHKQIASNQHKIVDLTARSMDHNFTISGLIESKNENCKMMVMEFFVISWP